MARPWTLLARRWAFVLCLLGVLVLALLPVPSHIPAMPWDKANHALAFAALAILGCWSWPGRARNVLLGLLAYGALLELLQALVPYRSAETLDLLADGVGLLAGWQAALLLRRLLKVAPTSG
ncbi:MAG: VanZ family protein [Ramlibacter sp.]|nr:VanZ family protein [Ramlibacter sp.]